MASFSLRRYETQARVSTVIAAVSAVALLGLAFLVLRHMDFGGQYVITYGPKRRMAVLGMGAVTMLLSAIAFGMGYSSAGQRRNEKPVLSWIGFFGGAGIFCLCALLLILFQLRGEAAITG